MHSNLNLLESAKSALMYTYEDYAWDYYDWWYKWNHNWHVCNVFCKMYIILDFVVLFTHYLINMFTLGGWANGSIFLLANTYYSTYITLLSSLLLIGDPTIMMAPYSTRLTMFIFATISVTMFTGNCATIVFKYITGSTP